MRQTTALAGLITTLALALSLLLPISVAAQSAAPPSGSSGGPDGVFHDPDSLFYARPADVQLPAGPGHLIRSEPAAHLLNLADPVARDLGMAQPELPGRAHRILYTSETAEGNPAVVSGVVIEPAVAWTGNGPTPTLVMAPGTRGQGRACAPSLGAGLLGTVDLQHGAISLNYELPLMYRAALQGMRVVMTDYIGLGTEAVHRYVNSTESAHAVLDAARAGLEFAGVPSDSPVAFFGYSQGGGAAAAAAENAGVYAPELNIKGTYAGAPPADLTAVMAAVDGSLISGVLGYAINGAGAENSDDRVVYETVLENASPMGREFLQSTLTGCMGDTALRWGFRDTRELTATGESFSELAARKPEVGRFLADQRLGTKPLNAPMLVINGVHDDLIPFDQAATMATDYCAQGGAVSLIADQTPPLPQKTGLNHAAPLFTQAETALQWVTDRFNGIPAPSDCERLLA